MAEPSDAELLDRLRRGEADALEPLVRRWERSLFVIAWRIVGNAAEAEEVRQNVFLRMLERPEQLPQPESLAAWLRRCTVNAAISTVRRRRHRVLKSLPEEIPDQRSDRPERALLHTEDAARLREALDQFTPQDRALLALRFDEDLTFAEIAEALERPASTVKSRYARLIELLRSLMDERPRELSKRTDHHG